MNYSVKTRLVHAAHDRKKMAGAVNIPIFQSSTFEYGGNSQEIPKYIRLNNTPTHDSLQQKLAWLEGADESLVTASGMSAISTALLSFLSQGDEWIAPRGLYGGTYDFAENDLRRLGINLIWIDEDDEKSWDSACTSKTKVFYFEAISNPTLKVPNFEKWIQFAKNKGLITIVDATLASPVNFKPIEIGVDVVVHSATKYLNGHSDLLAGVISTNKMRIPKILKTHMHLGASLDPHTCYLLERGLKTVFLRVSQQNFNAYECAHWLSQQPQIHKVNYPFLESDKNYPMAKKYFTGGGGVLSFELNRQVDPEKFLSALRLPMVGPSLGGVESLITIPARTSHAAMGKEERQKAGIDENLIRMSVGIEDVNDLIGDLAQALSQAKV